MESRARAESPQPARKEACRHFKTPFCAGSSSAAVIRYAGDEFKPFPQPPVDTRRHPGSRAALRPLSLRIGVASEVFRPYSGARKPPWWRGFSIRAKGHENIKTGDLFKFEVLTALCPLRTLATKPST